MGERHCVFLILHKFAFEKQKAGDDDMELKKSILMLTVARTPTPYKRSQPCLVIELESEDG